MPTAETARADRFAAYVDRLAAVLGHRVTAGEGMMDVLPGKSPRCK